MPTLTLTGTASVADSATSASDSLPVSALFTVSQVLCQRLVLPAGISDYVVSVPVLSAPTLIWLTATSLVRVNVAGLASMVSAGSAGQLFRELYALAGSGANLPSALHFANSTADSAVITLLVGM